MAAGANINARDNVGAGAMCLSIFRLGAEKGSTKYGTGDGRDGRVWSQQSWDDAPVCPLST